MKTLITLLSLCSVLSYGQLSKADFNFTENRAWVKEKSAEFVDGSDKKTMAKTSFFSSISQFESLGIDLINSMLNQASEKVMWAIKNRHSYTPKEIRIDYQDGAYRAWVDYTAGNDLGAIKSAYSFVYFDEKGQFVKIINY